MDDFLLKTPVAFIIFNRPDNTEKVFAEIARARPPKLLLVGDGPRKNYEGETVKVLSCRDIIKRVDWPCEVLTNFSEINLGCKHRVSSGLDWVFEQVSEAIILEDDCLPHPLFFRFCQELLEYYRYDQRVSMISGDNFLFGHYLNDESYYYSKYNHIWGWASWRNRWQHDYDIAIKQWPKVRDEGRIVDLANTTEEQKYLTEIFEKVYQGQIDTWDYQWNFGSRLNGRISVMPNVNLVSNIGFGSEGTHTTGISIQANMATKEMKFPLKHPVAMFASAVLDTRYFRTMIFNSSLYRRVRVALANLLRKK